MANPKDSLTWNVREDVYKSQWTRMDAGDPNEQKWVDDGGYPIFIYFIGDNVFVRRFKADGLHFYHGQISEDGYKISGKYLMARITGDHSWSAEIVYEPQRTANETQNEMASEDNYE